MTVSHDSVSGIQEEVRQPFLALMWIAAGKAEERIIRGVINTAINEDLRFAIKPASSQWYALLDYLDRVRKVAHLLVEWGVKWPLINNELGMATSAVLADLGCFFVKPSWGDVTFVGHGQKTSELLVIPTFGRIATLHEAMENPYQEFKLCRVEDDPSSYYDAAVIAFCQIRASTSCDIALDPSRYDAIKRTTAMLRSIDYSTVVRFYDLLNVVGKTSILTAAY